MANCLTRRYSFWKRAFYDKVRSAVAIFIALFTVVFTIRDGIVDPKNRDWFLLKYVPNLPWYWWLIIGVFALLFFALEGAYDVRSREIAGFQRRYRERLKEKGREYQDRLTAARIELLATHVTVNKEPTLLEEKPTKEEVSPLTRPEEVIAKAKPVIECVDVATFKVLLDGNNRITKDERGSNKAAFAYFHLKPLPDSESWVHVRAIISFHDLDNNRKGRGKDGVWHKHTDKEITFSMGDTYPLVIGLFGNRELSRFCVSGDNQSFSLERTRRLCHQLDLNCLMNY